MRGKGFRSRRPDQPVDEHDVAVRYGLEEPTQSGQGRVVGMRPLPDDLVLANRPPPRSQAGAYAQVVDVAAARPRRVADPGGHDDVDPVAHGARSYEAQARGFSRGVSRGPTATAMMPAACGPSAPSPGRSAGPWPTCRPSTAVVVLTPAKTGT